MIFALAILAATVSAASSTLLECEQFDDLGGWTLDTAAMDSMGSPYLLAHGLGQAVADAKTTLTLPEGGAYAVWVRTRNWTAPWSEAAGAGRFQVVVDDKPIAAELGTQGDGSWSWVKAGEVSLSEGRHKVALHDLTGFDGRCDAVVFVPAALTSPALAGLRHSPPAVERNFDLVVVGGGVAGISAAVTAARLGLKTALVQDRPVLGGNNSSEVRVHVGGYMNLPPYPRLGDVTAEIVPSTCGNAQPAINYEDDRKLAVVRAETNLTLCLNTRIVSVTTNAFHRIVAVAGLDVRSGERTVFSAPVFVDATGDGNVGFMAGADFRQGRESRMEYGEPSAPERSDALTMGSSVQWYAEMEEKGCVFPWLPWMLPFDEKSARIVMRGDWDWETGFGRDQVMEAERIRDYGLLVVYSNWAYVKNRSSRKAEFADARLKWVASVAGKRESRRLLGDLVLTQNHLRNHDIQIDGTCSATWTIDQHLPKSAAETGFAGEPFQADSLNEKILPHPIPYRCLYSRNVSNLFMAGRDISVSHVALGTTRLMRTHGMMGEVVGMAAAVCRTEDCLPRDVFARHWDKLVIRMRQGTGSGLAQPRQDYNVQASLNGSIRNDYLANVPALITRVTPGAVYEAWPMLQAAGDRLICVFAKARTHDDWAGGACGAYASVSTDAGATWSPPTVVADTPSAAEVPIGKGLDRAGAALFWVRSCAGGVRRHVLYRTRDGKRFERISEPVLDPVPVQITDVFSPSASKLMALWFATDYRGDRRNGSWGTLASEDNGITWRQTTVERGLSLADTPTEPSAAVLPEGRILVVARTEIAGAQGGRQFQLTSVDGGGTWRKSRTNIGDVWSSTPSLVYDRTSGKVLNYYYERGPGLLKCREAPLSVFSEPQSWPKPEVCAAGGRERPHDSGNASATQLKGRPFVAYYSGNPQRASVWVYSKSSSCPDARSRSVADLAVRGTVTVVNVPWTFKDNRIDWLFNPTKAKGPFNPEWTWQLNRMDFWPAMAEAYRATGDEKYACAFARQAEDWLDQTGGVPSEADYNGVGSPWRTIEEGLRLMGSWPTAWKAFKDSPNFSASLRKRFVEAMRAQAKHLMRHRTGQNWLLMEMNGVHAFASLFPDFPESTAFRRESARILGDELRAQLLPDGFQYELSPDYHIVLMHCLCPLYRRAKETGHLDELPKDFCSLIEKAVDSQLALMTPAFVQPRFNDCYTMHTAGYVTCVGGILPEREDFRWVKSRGESGDPPSGATASRYLPWSGFAVSPRCARIGPPTPRTCALMSVRSDSPTIIRTSSRLRSGRVARN